MSSATRAFKSRIEQDDLYSIPIDAFFKSAFSVDCVILGYHKGELKVLLIERGTQPFEGYWALPGDLVYPMEELDNAAVRILNDLTHLTDIPVRQIKTFGKVDRHPLGRVITIAYIAIVEISDIKPQASSWAVKTKWHNINRIPKLAFDHKEILNSALKELKTIVKQEPVWNKILPQKFTISELQLFYETILEKKFDKGNFRKKTSEMSFLIKLSQAQKNVRHRPSLLYRFDERKYNTQKGKGFYFDL